MSFKKKPLEVRELQWYAEESNRESLFNWNYSTTMNEGVSSVSCIDLIYHFDSCQAENNM